MSKLQYTKSTLIGLIGFLPGALLYSSTPNPVLAASCDKVAGDWKIQSTIGKHNCDQKVKGANLDAEIEQNGCKIKIDIGVSLKGTISGSTARVKGSYWWFGSTTKDITLNFQGNKLSGNGKWTYSAMGYKCEGSESFTGQKK